MSIQKLAPGTRVRALVSEGDGFMYSVGQEGIVLADEEVDHVRYESNAVWVEWDPPSIFDRVWVIDVNDAEVIA
jgi:hypothetical protein